MENNTIIRILNAHEINYTIVNNHIIAEEVLYLNGELSIETSDLTGYTKSQLYAWLGY